MAARNLILLVLLEAAGLASAWGGSNSSSSSASGENSADEINLNISHWLGWVWVALLGAFFSYQIVLHLMRYIRTIACLNNDTQRYFAIPQYWYGTFKRHWLDAPLFRTRHHREFRISAALNVGTLPTRLQMAILIGYFVTNIAFCIIFIDFSKPETQVAPILRNRFGVLSVMNMIPLFILSGRNNPFIKMCGISFDTFNLLHRWIGRIVVLEAVGHTLAWLIPKVQTSGFKAVAAAEQSQFILTGTIGTCALVAIFLVTPSIIRHAFYETFLHLHIILAGVAVATIWFHLKDLPQLPIIWGVVGIWAAERTMRFARLIYHNVGRGGTKVEVEVLPGDALRVNMKIARPWRFQPGQHIYLYMPSVSLWLNHPFSLAWSEEIADESDASSEKGLPLSRQDMFAPSKTSMSLIIRRRTGFTDTLFKKAENTPTGKFTATAFVEGPYGGNSFTSYGTVMLWAAGVGITHQVPHVRHLVAGYANGTSATRRLTLVWIIQSPEHLEWIRPWMTAVLNMPKRRDVLKILLFITRPRSTKEIHSPSSSVQMFPGKPNVQALIDQEMAESLGAACISCCGTGALADDLRKAVRNRQSVWNVDFKEESFSW